MRLDDTLGEWTTAPRTVKFQFYRSEDEAYNRNADGFLRYRLVHRGVFQACGEVDDIPCDAHPIGARFNEDGLWTIQQHRIIRSQPYNWATVIDYVMSVDGPDMGGSDGSVYPLTGDRASSGCVQIRGTRYGNDRKYPRSQYSTSFRSELEGINQTLDIIAELDETGEIDLFVDNDQAGRQSMKEIWKPSQTLKPEADILLSIQHKRRRPNVNATIHWIKAHQDDHEDHACLAPPAQLNYDMDDRSKRKRVDGPVNTPHYPPHSGAMLVIENEWVTTKYHKQIHDASTKATHRRFFLHKVPTE